MKKYMSSLYVLLGMVALTFYVIFRNYQLGDVFQIAKSADIRLILLGVVMVFVHLVLGGRVLQLLLRSMRKKSSLMACSKYAGIEFYFSAITPSATGGQPAQAFYMAKDGIPAGSSTVALLLITVVYKLVLLFLGIVVVLFRLPLVFGGNTIWIFLLFILGFVINVAVIAFCLTCMFSRNLVYQIAVKGVRLLVKLHLMKEPERKIAALDHYVAGLRESAGYVKQNFGLSVRIFFLTLVQRVALFSVSYLIYRSFGLSSTGYFDFLAIQVIIAIAVDSLPLPGGVGISEAIFLILYKGIYSASMLVSAMILSRGISYYFYLVLTAGISIINHLVLMHEQKKMAGY
ncbi:lysylphosphatidylglycerol synthase transmembrane domain-containing protein [Anaerolentibacter hominis]|uniref:lysylphosphatidylglycerol synthase transmembrane domain-containing protein n=1 Tax=Anaerolentibacter hominis TaxID=3079009 RepID=UPI0031B89F84